ncbi:MAG: hypothetical protein KDK64_04190 [Chlamydiia bacterium]|nr:hypothetical protein [Chlamydiia bacterium]
MLKKLKGTLLINGIGLAVLFVCLFGYQKVMSISSGQVVTIDFETLKEELHHYPKEELKKMLQAGEEILAWNALLAKTGSDVVNEVLKGQGMFWEMDHYPIQDTFDQETFSQYYYHAHRGGEHGHFHLFLRQGGMEKGMVPLLYDVRNDTLNDVDTYAHLIAISMSHQGHPLSLFTTNRWVTGEDWYASEDVKKMLNRFSVNHAHPSYVVNQWLSAMLVLFRPQIDALIEERDMALMRYATGVPLKEILEDQEFDVTSERPISVAAQIEVLRTLLEE